MTTLTNEQIDEACSQIFLDDHDKQEDYDRAIARAVIAALASQAQEAVPVGFKLNYAQRAFSPDSEGIAKEILDQLGGVHGYGWCQAALGELWGAKWPELSGGNSMGGQSIDDRLPPLPRATFRRKNLVTRRMESAFSDAEMQAYGLSAIEFAAAPVTAPNHPAVPAGLLEALKRWHRPAGDSDGACRNLLNEIDAWLAAAPAVTAAPADVEASIKYMSIYGPAGARVVFHAEGGYENEKTYALQAGLKIGEVYTVHSTEVGQSRSSVKLREIHGSWNTVMFGPAPNSGIGINGGKEVANG